LKLNPTSSDSLLWYRILSVSTRSARRKERAETHNPHLSAPLFSSVNLTHLTCSSVSAASNGSNRHSAMSFALEGRALRTSSSAFEAEVAVRASRRVVRRAERVVEEVTGIRIVAERAGESVRALRRGRK
jgi:hypothetical protein